jgi:hypothetical protein
MNSKVEGEELTACRTNCHRTIPHAREIGNAYMFFVVKNQSIVLTLCAIQGPL